jgi:hypothetical protein
VRRHGPIGSPGVGSGVGPTEAQASTAGHVREHCLVVLDAVPQQLDELPLAADKAATIPTARRVGVAALSGSQPVPSEDLGHALHLADDDLTVGPVKLDRVTLEPGKTLHPR